MSKTTTRVSVVRVSRQIPNQNEIDHEPIDSHLKPPELSHKKEHHYTSKRKSDAIALNIPRESDIKSEDIGRHSNVIQNQPHSTDSWMKNLSNNINRPELNWKANGKWSNNLCSLSEDCNMSCYACACWCCFRHELSNMMGEHWCLWFLNCSPLMELRTKFRQQYGIKGSIAEDFCLSIFCPLCVAIQLANEGRNHGHRIFS